MGDAVDWVDELGMKNQVLIETSSGLKSLGYTGGIPRGRYHVLKDVTYTPYFSTRPTYMRERVRSKPNASDEERVAAILSTLLGRHNKKLIPPKTFMPDSSYQERIINHMIQSGEDPKEVIGMLRQYDPRSGVQKLRERGLLRDEDPYSQDEEKWQEGMSNVPASPAHGYAEPSDSDDDVSRRLATSDIKGRRFAEKFEKFLDNLGPPEPDNKN